VMINITQLCRDANWHLRTAIEELSKHLSWEEAESFAEFAFADHADEMGGVRLSILLDGRPEDYLTDEQWDRLSLKKSDWVLEEA
jgi:hypothetical protein